jgi:hypothetical protein
MDKANGRGQIGMFGAAFMGIGAMMGAGIFALLRVAGAMIRETDSEPLDGLEALAMAGAANIPRQYIVPLRTRLSGRAWRHRLFLRTRGCAS